MCFWGWMFMSFWTEPLFPLGSPAWLVMTIAIVVCVEYDVSIDFDDKRILTQTGKGYCGLAGKP